MIRRSVLLSLAALLTGCSSCQVASYYKPLADNGKHLQTYAQLPGYVGLTLGGTASAMIAACGDRHPPAPGDSIQLCMSVELASNSSMRFLDGSIRLTAGKMKPVMVQLASIEYEVWCRADRAGTRVCSSSEESPVDGTRIKRPGSLGTDRYVFDPMLAFRGAVDSLHEGAVLGHRLSGTRRYLVRTVPLTTGKETHISVRFPDVLVDGQRIAVPPLQFQAVTEELCRMLPLA